MSIEKINAAAAGTWTLGDRTVNRLGFGAMRLPQTGQAFAADAVPRDRDQAIRVLRRAVERPPQLAEAQAIAPVVCVQNAYG
jgi:aryl-alcohol dehydrogenase-like predicted oxidoreductase